MPAIKHDPRADRRSWWAIAVAGWCLGLGMLMWAALGWALAGFLCSFLGGFGGVLWFFTLSHRYHCPQCGARLPYRGGPAPGAKALYHCHRCDVMWDTGLVEGGEPDAATLAGGPVSEEVLAQIHERLFASDRIGAIERWRAACGGSLRESVFRIDEIEDALRTASPGKFTHPRRDS